MTTADLDQGTKAVTAAGTAERLTSANLVRSVELHARKNRTTANTGNIYVGVEGGSGLQYRVVEPGESFTISAGEDEVFDLSGIWIDAATSADAVTWTALK